MIKKTSKYFQLLFSCVFIFSSFSLAAQNIATVYGVIKDDAGKPLEDVAVSVLGSSQPPAYSDKNGNYTYVVPAGQELTIVFNNLSYVMQKQVVKLSPNEKKELSPKLVFKNQIKEVEVTDKTRFQQVTRLDPMLVSKLPSASQDFNAILFTLPGVSSRNELSSSYSVRGGNFDENLVYVNGVEIYRPFLVRAGQQEGLSFINPDMVSSVLFSAGAFEAKYGDKMSSVLDVQYRKPRKFSGTASGSFLGSNLRLEGTSKNYRLTWIIGARYKTNQYLVKGLNNTNGTYKPLFGDLQTYITYSLTNKWELQFLGYSAGNKYQFIPADRETNFGSLNQILHLQMYFGGQEVDRFNTQLGALTAAYHSIDNKLNLRFIGSVYNDNEAEAYDIQAQYYLSELQTGSGGTAVPDSANSIGVGTDLSHSRTRLNAAIYSAEHKGSYGSTDKQLLWGVKYSSEEISDKINQWKYVDSAGYSIPHTNPETITLQNVVQQNINISSNRIAGYVQGVWQKETKDTSSLSLTAGLRGNYWDFNKQALLAPRASVGYKPNWKKDYVFKFATGYYYQPPFFREMLDMYGTLNPNTKAQTSIHFVLSSDHNLKIWNRPFKFTSEAYYKILNNITPYQVNNVWIQYTTVKNDAQGYVKGIDFKLNGEFIKDLESWFSLSVMNTEYKIKNEHYYTYYNSAGTQIVPGSTTNSIVVDSVRHDVGYVPRPTDQRVNFGIFFQDKMPNIPDLKMHLNMIFGTGVPFGFPGSQPYQQTLRMPAYRRVDIGFSYQALKEEKKEQRKKMGRYIKSIWISLEVWNLLGINNTVSYLWVQGVTGNQYAVPNYLTNRQLNVRTVIAF